MKNMIVKSLAVAAIAAMILLVHRTSQARGVLASAGRPINSSCFSINTTSTLTNVCSTIQTIHIPLSVDTSNNWHQAWFSAYGSSPSNNVGCRLVSSDQNGGVYTTGARKYLPSFGTSQFITLDPIWVPSWGVAYIDCLVSPGGRVNEVHWN